MIQSMQRKLKTVNIILASTSPRRKEILTKAGLEFSIVSSSFEENLEKSSFPSATDYAVENARQKALDVARTLREKDQRFDLVIGADTVVVLNGEILEKPKTEDIAKTMLKKLSGKSHTVSSGVAFISSNPSQDDFIVHHFHEETQVNFAQLDDDIISTYVATGEPLDKAGGYGIQGLGGSLVEGINGDYYNVVGFPLFKFCRELRSWLDKRS